MGEKEASIIASKILRFDKKRRTYLYIDVGEVAPSSPSIFTEGKIKFPSPVQKLNR